MTTPITITIDPRKPINPQVEEQVAPILQSAAAAIDHEMMLLTAECERKFGFCPFDAPVAVSRSARIEMLGTDEEFDAYLDETLEDDD